MYTVTADFLAEVRNSHDVVVSASVWNETAKLADLTLISGSVSVDARRAVRRTCEITVADPSGRGYASEVPVTLIYSNLTALYGTYGAVKNAYVTYGGLLAPLRYDEVFEPPALVPANANDALTPFGNELRLYRGVRYADGSEEIVPLGVFVITKTEIQDDGESLTISLSGDDRSVRISRARWTRPYRIANGTNVGTAIKDLLSDRWAGVTFAFQDTDATTSTLTFGLDSDNDPWQDALSIAEAAGLDLYFNGDGVAVLEPLPDVTVGTVDASYEENADGVTLNIAKSITAERTYNGVIVTGEGSEVTDPPRAEAWDDNSASPTYRYGKFGEVPTFYTSPMIRTVTQAQNTANSLLSKYLGADESIEFGLVVNPAHDVNDLVKLESFATRTSKVLILDALTIPLSAEEAMRAVARTTRIYG